MDKRRTIAIGVLAGVLVVGGGGWAVWSGGETTRQRQAVADTVASDLAALKLTPTNYVSTTGQDAATEMDAVVKNVAIKPQVSLTALKPRSDSSVADATYRVTWTPIPGADPWVYDTTAVLRKTADGWKAEWSPALVDPDLKASERLVYTRLQPTRGAVLGAGGAKLAWTQPAIRMGIDKAQLDAEAAPGVGRVLATALTSAGIPVDADAYAARVQAAGPKAFVEAAVLRAGDPAQLNLANGMKSTRGIGEITTQRALGMTSSFARPLLGVVGEAGAETVANSGGALAPGDMVGTAGLQQAQDATLRGADGYVFQALPRTGTSTARDLKRLSAVDGHDVTTTLSVPLQQAAEAALAGVKPASAVVAVRPSDGAVLAAASGPGSNGYPTATLGMYEPGSTFKTVSGLGMIRKLGLTASSPVECPPSLVIDGFTFHNDVDYPASKTGTLPWTTAFAYSCNTTPLGAAAQVSQADLRSAAGSLGVTSAPRLGVPASFGKVPATASGQTEHAASMIGQGNILMTPLGMAVVSASIEKGATVTPTLVTNPAQTGPTVVRPASATPGWTPAPAPTDDPVVPLQASEAETIKTLLRAVVTQGTAMSALSGVPGGEVLAKTGTSTFVDNGQTKYHTWMIAIQGDLAVAVLVSEGDYGATTCGPIMKQFLTAAHA